MLSSLLSKKGSLCYLASALQHTGSWCLLSDVSLKEDWSCLRDLKPNCASEICGVGVSSLSAVTQTSSWEGTWNDLCAPVTLCLAAVELF